MFSPDFVSFLYYKYLSLQEIERRIDLREECIFTIDPSTARDLDDAVSCHPLPSGNFRVGVHIADVTYFLKEETILDKIASDRSTSVYLVQKVIPMLPRVLCENLCSLNPGEDRLAFSVIWELDPFGKVIGEFFGRTVIRSCVKLSYDHAQSMIENPKKDWSLHEFPSIIGNFTLRNISSVVYNLHSIAKHLRKKRFDDGALRLDQVKIAFNLDNESGMPNGFYEYIIKDSNRLIEEFMLLANMAVAHKIYEGYPNLAILRRHPSPLERPMEQLKNLLNGMEVHLDITCAGALQKSLQYYIGDDKHSVCRLQVITALCSKPMQNAKYFCAGAVKPDESFCHYALNVPLYTHFTSPIRRYADVLVHRMLAAVIDPVRYQPTVRGQLQLQKITDRCNDRKQTSKIVQELSCELYLALFIKQINEMDEEAMVTMVLDRSFDVLLLKMGVIKRVYIEKLPLESFELKKQEGRKYLYLYWKSERNIPNCTQRISLFTLVSVTLKPVEGNSLKFSAVLRRPS
ncbi:DIS3-like exonuclease 2 [Halocaridina rubra]|uniref:DIS3-like exonuclease 2 n=1 Tax=Halocaridina rubra TaxID=373956 RepID=A0AAN8WA65_HALRR